MVMPLVKLTQGFFFGLNGLKEALACGAVRFDAALFVRRELLNVLFAAVLEDLLEFDQARSWSLPRPLLWSSSVAAKLPKTK